MASKSKKRRRVLGASCILAALIIAGSSFAWFTSKDEVTNRLSASADYNVSIIENFVPPKQWTPGQTVTKEEAVVNTGSIDAFVKQQITGDLKVTVELPTTTAPTAATAVSGKYIELNPSEYGSLEAGSYLAWGPVASEIGTKIIYAMDKEAEGGHALPQATDFTPSTTGLYIFRRAISTDANMTDTKYEYVGYYYIADTGKYYKLNDIDKSTLALVADGSGNLSAAPTVKYGVENTKVLKKVPMAYDSTADTLKVSYSTESSADLSTLAANDRATYNAYRSYLDAQTGKTKWDATRSSAAAQSEHTEAADTANLSGLTDYDEFDPQGVTGTVDPLLTNWSMDRLTKRAEETKAALDLASPTDTNHEYTTENWNTVYNDAVAERKTVNKGVKSATRLATLRETVIGLIGVADGDGNGLAQAATYPLHYSSTATTADPTTGDYAVTLLNGKKQKSSDIQAGDETEHKVLTIDNMDMARFQDPYFLADGTTGDKTGVFGTDVAWNDTTRKNPYTATSGALKDAWEAYVQQTKRMVLVQAKIDLLTAYTTTDVGRNDTERVNYLNVLKSNKAAIQADLDTAKANWQTQVTAVSGYLTTMNGYQDDINAANEVTGTDYGCVSTNPAGYPTSAADSHGKTWQSVVKNDGTKDTGKETTLKNYLIAVYGVAYRDSGVTEYTGAADGDNSDTDLYADIWTYSPTVTKTKIDNSLEEDGITGKIQWKASTQLEDTTNDPALIEAKPYYIDKKVNMMKDRRDHQINDVNGENGATADGLLKVYQDALATSNGSTAEGVTVGPIDIIVQLANLDDAGTTPDSWQYIADATAANEYNFYYTSLLPSGQTSKLLIKSVKLSEAVTQDMFRDIQFDLNVNAESAQAVYEGDIARPTSANETLSGAKTTDDGYRTGDVVTWEKDTTTKTAPTDEDPNPKADATVPVAP
jgi:predicted ribosomally synthesized peptide with SipW-like signal peptide